MTKILTGWFQSPTFGVMIVTCIAGLIAWKAATEIRIVQMENRATSHENKPAHYEAFGWHSEIIARLDGLDKRLERIEGRIDRRR